MAQIKIDGVVYGSNNASDIIYNDMTVADKLNAIPIFDPSDNANIEANQYDYLTYGHIIDNLASSDTNKVLSANQGKILNEKIDNIDLSYLEDGIGNNTESINNINNDLELYKTENNSNLELYKTENNNKINEIETKIANLNDNVWAKVNFGFAESYFGSVNLNDYLSPGMYRLNNNHTNMPSNSTGWGQLLVITGGGDTIAQLYFPYNTTSFYLRAGNVVGNSSGSWTSWRTI